jgi:hypothetical protein
MESAISGCFGSCGESLVAVSGNRRPPMRQGSVLDDGGPLQKPVPARRGGVDHGSLEIAACRNYRPASAMNAERCGIASANFVTRSLPIRDSA